MNDVVTYNEKHNEANQEGNTDGTFNNRSWNCGAEGPTEDPEIQALRERQMRNMLATLLLSQGTPMVLAGDEFARTQGGNNNAYCQDNEISWVDWTQVPNREPLIRFVRKLCGLRHKYPIFRRNLFLNGELVPDLDVRDVTWINPAGSQIAEADWQSPVRCFGMLLDGRAQTTGIRQRGKEATMLILINGHHDPVNCVLPEIAGARQWSLLLDTNVPEHSDAAPEIPPLQAGSQYTTHARSLAVFALYSGAQ